IVGFTTFSALRCEPSLKRLVPQHEVTDAIVAAAAQIGEYVFVVPLRDVLRQRELRETPRNTPTEEALGNQVVQEERQAGTAPRALAQRPFEPVLIARGAMKVAE